MNTTELIQICHNAAKEKGFWEKERNQSEAFALILSELYEAFEAHRKGKFANMQQFNELTNGGEYTFENSPITSKYHFEQQIKDTLEDELADVLIRCFDFCGGFKMWIYDNNFIVDSIFLNSENIGEKVLRISYLSTKNYYEKSAFDAVQQIYFNVIALCQELNIDIETHINLKLQYNATRPQKHGANY